MSWGYKVMQILKLKNNVTAYVFRNGGEVHVLRANTGEDYRSFRKRIRKNPKSCIMESTLDAWENCGGISRVDVDIDTAISILKRTIGCRIAKEMINEEGGYWGKHPISDSSTSGFYYGWSCDLVASNTAKNFFEGITTAIDRLKQSEAYQSIVKQEAEREESNVTNETQSRHYYVFGNIYSGSEKVDTTTKSSILH